MWVNGMNKKHNGSVKSRASLEQIFGSRTRVRLLKLFLEKPEQKYYVREITRNTRSHIHSVRRELSNLNKIGLIQCFEDESDHKQRMSRKFYAADPRCIIFGELKSLMRKGQLFLQEEFARQLSKIGSIKYLALTGFFVDLQGFPTDLLIVGRIAKNKCANLIRGFEDEFGRTINYTILTPSEFIERKEMTDRFLYNFFENKKVVLIDRLPVSIRIGGKNEKQAIKYLNQQ